MVRRSGKTEQLARFAVCAERDPAGPRRAYDGGMDNIWVAVLWGLIPTVVVLSLFIMILRGILRFDRTERRAHASIEAEERARRGLPPRES